MTTVYLSQFVLVVGNPVDGLSFYGPFEHVDEATAYAQDNQAIRGQTWVVAPLSAATDRQWTPPKVTA